MALVQVTSEDLRNAIRDPRYWQQGHPERQAFNAWVTRGFQAMYGGDAPIEGRQLVFVNAYTRERDGHTEHVSAHSRHAPSHRSDHVGRQNMADTPIRMVSAERPMDGNGLPGLPGDRKQVQGTGSGGGSPRSGAIQGTPSSTPAPSSGPLLPSPSTPDGLRAAAQRVPDWNNRVKYRGGGASQQQADFAALQPTDVRTNGQGVTFGTLPDGTRAVLRTSERNGVTLEIHSESKGIIAKIRY